MKKIALMLTIVSLSLSSLAQTAEEIVSKSLETMGGVEKMNKIQSIHMYANIDQMGMKIPLEFINTKSGKMLVKANFQGQEIIQVAFDGKDSWGTNFMTMKPEKNDSEATENLKRQSMDIITPLYDYKKKGYTIEKMTDETVEGVACYKVKMTKKPTLSEGKEVPNVEFYYFDKENFVTILVDTEITDGEMKGSIQQTLFSDYQEVDGVYFPFTMTNRMKGGDGQSIVFTKIELNKAVEDKQFAFPEGN